MISRTQFEILVYVEKNVGTRITQRQIAEATGISLGMVNKILAEFLEKKVLVLQKKLYDITPLGQEILYPFRVKRAVIIAAGFGSRLVPITLNTPKPLVRVHGKRMIETLLDAIIAAGIEEIIMVRGYLEEQFDVLKRKYPQIQFFTNPLYNESNNISSLFLVRNYLQNAYICDADFVVKNPGIIRKYEYCTNYLGVFQEYTEDWCFQVKRGYITEQKIGGINCYHIIGISHWNSEDGEKLGEYVEKVFYSPGGKEKFWDMVALEDYKKEFKIQVRPCSEEDVVEIDTFSELKNIDSVYNV